MWWSIQQPVFKTHAAKPFMTTPTRPHRGDQPEKLAPPPLPGALKRGLGPWPYRARGRVFKRRRVHISPTSPYPLMTIRPTSKRLTSQMTTPTHPRRGDQPREICATAVARCAKARARPAALSGPRTRLAKTPGSHPSHPSQGPAGGRDGPGPIPRGGTVTVAARPGRSDAGEIA